MIQTSRLHPQWQFRAAMIIGVIALTIFTGVQVAQVGAEGANPIIAGALALALMYVVFRQPFIGLVIITATLPVDSLLPKIPYFTSLFPVIGGITILAYINERRRLGMSLFPRRWNATLTFALLFVLWIFISNPTAAYRQNRSVAIYTYFQLFTLVVLTCELYAADRRKYHILMWCYVGTCLYSAHEAIIQSSFGDTFDHASGIRGLSGINTNARQFTIAFLFLFYLRGNLKGMSRLLILFTWAAQLYLLQGVAVTGSRTGIVIAAIGIVLMLLAPTSRIRPQRVIIPAIVAGLVYTAVPDTYWDSIWNSIFPSIEEGTDTVAIRYELWETAWRMFVDKPFTGVGIDQFQRNVRAYSDPLSSSVRVTGAHSIYFSVLAETGLPGFLMYMGIIGSSIFYALRAAYRLRSEQDRNLAYLWFVALMLLLIGGLTKQDQYDKLLWLMFGACSAMSYFTLKQREEDQAQLETTRTQTAA
jgi:O-antigen ligase